MTMPGLPKKPAALSMDVTDDGHAIGLFEKSCQLFNKDK